MSRSFLSLLFLFFSLSVCSQEVHLLKGKITTDSLDGAFINIVNMSKEKGTVNTPSGEFEIEVSERDTLFFSSVQYELKEVVITADIISNGYLEIELVENINELAEVNISDIKLSGNLQADIADIPFFDQSKVGLPFSDKPRLTPIERQIYTASSSSLGLLLNTLSGRLKILKKAKKNQELEALVQKGMAMIPITVFVNDFALPEEHVVNFVYFCSGDSRFKALVAKADPLVMIEFFKGKVQTFFSERTDINSSTSEVDTEDEP